MESKSKAPAAGPGGWGVPAWVWISTVVLLVATVGVLLWKVQTATRDPAGQALLTVEALQAGAEPSATLLNENGVHVVVVFRYSDCPPCLQALETVQGVVDGALVSLDEEELGAVAVGSGYTHEEAAHVAEVHGWFMRALGDPDRSMDAVLRGKETPLVWLIDGRDEPRTLLRKGPAMLPVERMALESQLERSIAEALGR